MEWIQIHNEFHTNSFTNNQWIQVQNLLSHDRLNDGQFTIFTDMIDTSRQKLVLLHAGGGTGKTFITCKISMMKLLES